MCVCVCSEFRQPYYKITIMGPFIFGIIRPGCFVVSLTCVWLLYLYGCACITLSHYLIDSYHIHPPLLSYIFFPLWKDEIVLGKLEFEYYATKIKKSFQDYHRYSPKRLEAPFKRKVSRSMDFYA
jgi:hypothetical protein